MRHALALAYDFDTGNRCRLFRAREQPVQQLRTLPRRGLPRRESWRCSTVPARLPPEVFGRPTSLRYRRRPAAPCGANCLQARCSSCRVEDRADGKLRNAQGEAFNSEYLAPGDSVNDPPSRMGAQPGQARHQSPCATSTSRCCRSASEERLRRRHDRRAELRSAVAGGHRVSFLSSKAAADEKGNNNFRGRQGPVVDHPIEAMNRAQSPQGVPRPRPPRSTAW